jgi:hypothetical protein
VATVAITRTADPAGVAASSTIATYSGVSIGTAADDRIIVVVAGTELAGANPSACTIDGVTMNVGTGGDFAAVQTNLFWLPWPSGTTTNIAVKYSSVSPSATQNHISVYRVTGAGYNVTTGADQSTDMDATDALTTGSITIPTDGGFLAVAAGATDTVGKTWANATEDLDVDVGGFRHTTAIRTTAGTVTITCTGGTNGEDGAMSWIIFPPGYGVIAEANSYAVTGTAADFAIVDPNTPAFQVDAFQNDAFYAVLPGVDFAVDGGSYAVTGTAASLEVGKEVVAGAGSYTVTGAAASLEHNHETAADAGSYTVTGTNADLEHNQEVAADPGSYAVTGTDVALEHGYETAADAGTYVVTGTAATLVAPTGTTFAVDPGSYTVTGTAASLERSRLFAAGAGSYAVAGTTASLERGFETAAGAGAYTVSGTDAALEVGKEVLGGAGSYAVTGAAAGFIRGRSVIAGAGSYAVTGTAASLEHGWEVLAGDGSYAIMGTAANLERSRLFVAGAGSYAVSGTAATLFRGREVVADGGSYSVNGTAASLRKNSLADAFQTDAFLYDGFQMARQDITLANPAPGVYTITGTAASLDWSDEVLAAGAGAYTVTGSAAELLRYVMAGSPGSYEVAGALASLRKPTRQGYVWWWDGVDWRERPLKRWDGAGWQTESVKYLSDGNWTLG